MRSIAATVEPPVVTVSSTTRHAVAGLDRALDPALQAVLLALLADEEADQAGTAGDGDRGAGERDRGHHRPADRGRAGLAGGGGDQLAGGEEAGGPQQGAAGVDVIGGRLPAGERHLADHQRVLAQLGEQRLLRGVEVRGGGRGPTAILCAGELTILARSAYIT